MKNLKQIFKILPLFFGVILAWGLVFYFNTRDVNARVGDECAYDSDCERANRETCVGANDDVDPPTTGICEGPSDEEARLRAELGDSCNINSDCTEGLVCRSGTCDRPTGNDPADVINGGGSICTDDNDCSGSLECISGTCVNRTGGGASCTDNEDCSGGLECINNICGGSNRNNNNPSSSSNYGLDSVPSELPRDDIATVIVRIISYITGAVGIILLVMLIYGGVMYMTSAGNEEQAGKAKKVLTYAIIGIIIVALSFAITQFIVSALTGSGGGSLGSGSSGS